MLITVTKSDIEHGDHTYLNNPVALGIKHTTGAEHVSVLLGAMRSNIRIDGVVYLAPRLVWKFIDRFDAGDPVKPFLFNLTEPVTQ